ncbi:MAG TPA: sulfatase-like hydrolase/transferase, partial [Terriglobia bacterium]|nr:sulfatase-like hydrolase/transferase [Terriglobia bacterium]
MRMVKSFRRVNLMCFFTLAFFLVLATLSVSTSPAKKINVVLLVLDQLRADRLHCYGNARETSPNIDRLAQRGVRFSHFFAVSPWTSPSFASLHTSLFPSRHGVTLDWQPVVPLIDKDTPMLVPTFKYHGYYTTAFVNNGYAGQELTGRGFDEYYEGQKSAQNVNVTERLAGNKLYTAPQTTKLVLSWLEQHRSESFFLYVHLWEPHSPYNPPPEDDIFKSDAYPYLFDTGYDVAHSPAKRLAMLGDQKAIERLYELYDGKIHFVDRYVGQILDHLGKLGLQENTLVVLTSDHGELLYSHPGDFPTFDHRSLYDTAVHIPLIVAGPHVPEGRTINELASNIDTSPTVLDLAGLPLISDAQGQTLVPLIQGEKESLNQYIYLEQDLVPPQRAVRTLHYKLIRNLWTGKELLFDLDRDPGEQHSIIQGNPQVVEDLQAHLDEWVKQNEPPKEVQLRRWRIYTQASPTTIVDDSSIGSRFMITGGGWHSDTEPRSGNYEQGCFWAEGGNGSRTAVWRTDDPMLGTYKVYVYYGHPPVGR